MSPKAAIEALGVSRLSCDQSGLQRLYQRRLKLRQRHSNSGDALLSQKARQLVVKAAAQKQKIASTAPGLHGSRNRGLDVNFSQHFHKVAVRHQVVASRGVATQRFVKYACSIFGQVWQQSAFA